PLRVYVTVYILRERDDRKLRALSNVTRFISAPLLTDDCLCKFDLHHKIIMRKYAEQHDIPVNHNCC
ncbi:hypothetical protein M9458_051885, partial [Cirrhinus mrigala]